METYYILRVVPAGMLAVGYEDDDGDGLDMDAPADLVLLTASIDGDERVERELERDSYPTGRAACAALCERLR